MTSSSSFSLSSEQQIPLRRLQSSSSSTKQASSILTNPFSDAHSITSTLDSNKPLLLNSNRQDLASSWKPDRIFRIHTLGKPFIGMPSPVKDPVTLILEVGNEEGEGEREVYRSVRPKMMSGSCSLWRGDREVARITYMWGPGRDPVVQIFHGDEGDGAGHGDDDAMGEGGETFQVTKSSIWNRTHGFISSKYGTFSWRYANREERKIVSSSRDGREINSLLVLDHFTTPPKIGGKEKRERVAMFIRGDGTRTGGTTKRDAGNGGVLEMALSGGDGQGKQIIDEVTVLATVLVMLKKEVDRYRSRTIGLAAVLGGAAGGGS